MKLLNLLIGRENINTPFMRSSESGQEGINMKAAQLYTYDKEMNVELKIETVPEPTINNP